MIATMSFFPCCATCSEGHDEKSNEKQQNQTVETTKNADRKALSVSRKSTKPNYRNSLRDSVKQLLKHQAKFSFANISFKSDGSKHRYIDEEIAKYGTRNITTKVFTYHDLCQATADFKPENLLGEGGFGRVYKGIIENNNQVVAIKQLDRNGLQGNREFLMEVFMLSLLQSPHLVNLVGYCAEGSHRLLVYEHMAKGSLEDHLLDRKPDKKPLNWQTRMKIAKGAAKGLDYLHEVANPSVIYRDFKASNVLLDENFDSKLSDFGLVKVVPTGEESQMNTRVMGTCGYCAPEYASKGQLTVKSDVYSFGVVLLEIITGKRVIDHNRPEEEQNLVLWAQPMFRDKSKFHLMVDPSLEGDYPVKSLYQALGIAAMCLQENASKRPYMSEVVTALEYLTGDKTVKIEDTEVEGEDEEA